MQTARSRTSGENLTALVIAPTSRTLEPPQIPWRFTPYRNGIKEFALLTVGGEGSKPRARHQHQAGVAGAAPGARLEGQTVVRRSIKSLTVSSTPACTRRPDDDLAPQSHIWTATTSWHERAKLETSPWRAGGSFAPTQSLHHNPTSFSQCGSNSTGKQLFFKITSGTATQQLK